MQNSAGHLQPGQSPTLEAGIIRHPACLPWCALILAVLWLGIASGKCMDTYILINGIGGDSTAPGHVGWTDVLSMGHGISMTLVSGGGGSGFGRPVHEPLTFTKRLDQGSPLLYNALCRGTVIPNAQIDFMLSAPTVIQFYKVTLNNVIVTSVQASANGDVPTETISLVYGQVTWTYTQVNAPGQPASTASWNLTNNTGNYSVTLSDSDHDGLPDAWEMQYFNTLAYGANDDPDHDGLSNYQEFFAGTNPNDANSVLRVTDIQLASGQVNLTWNSVAGKTYTIYSASKVNGPYSPMLVVPSAGDGVTSTNLPGSTFNQFYRVAVP